MEPRYPRPDPVLDRKEESLSEKRAADFERMVTPGPIKRGLTKVGERAVSLAPSWVSNPAKKAANVVTESEIWDRALNLAGEGFGKLTRFAARYQMSRDAIIERVQATGHDIGSFDEIASVRSYDLERLVTGDDAKRVWLAAGEGLVTGSIGLPGVPFNLALSYLLYFRATQQIALHYGYDVIGDPAELLIASETTMLALAPKVHEGGLSGTLTKMALAGNLSALRHSLSHLTYTEMARRGGAELLYVQIRALANKGAARALQSAGQKGLEASVFRKMLERVGANMPARIGSKGIPIVGGILGAGIDAAYMSRVVYGANLIYHKRFLFEKEERIRILYGGDDGL